MSDIKIVVGADVSQATSGLRAVQGELGKTAAISRTATSAFSSIGASISGLGSSLISGGILTGIALIGAGLVSLVQDMFKVTEAQQRLSDVLDGAKNAYVKATLEVEKMADVFERAKTGVISKEAALKVYNSTIGKTIGQTDSLETAEKTFIEQAPNYIKYTLLKAAANIAHAKAAEAAFKAEEERIKGPTKEGSFLASLAGRGTAFGGGGSDLQRQQARINEALKQQVDLEKIYNKLLDDANNLKFKGVEKTEEEVEIEKEKLSVIKKQKAELINTDHFTKFLGLDNKLTAGALTVKDRPKLIIQPDIKFIVPSDEVAAKLRDFLKKLELERLSEEASKIIKDSAVNAITGVGDAIGESLAGKGNFFGNVFSAIFKALGAGIRQLGVYAVTTSKLIVALKATIGTTLGIAGGLALIALGTLISAAASKIQGPKFASGVRNFAGGFATVGERGPENIYLPRGSTVQPNNEVRAFGGGGITLMPSIHYEGDGFRIMLNRVDQRFGRNN